MKNILLPLELENPKKDEMLVAAAIEYALPFNAKCWLVHVVPPEPDFIGYDVGPQYIRDQLAENFREDHKKIQAIANQLKAKGLDAEGLLIQGATVEMIEREIEKLNIDLLIIANRKYGFTDILFKGSVRDELIESHKVPILLVPFHED